MEEEDRETWEEAPLEEPVKAEERLKMVARPVLEVLEVLLLLLKPPEKSCSSSRHTQASTAQRLRGERARRERAEGWGAEASAAEEAADAGAAAAAAAPAPAAGLLLLLLLPLLALHAQHRLHTALTLAAVLLQHRDRALGAAALPASGTSSSASSQEPGSMRAELSFRRWSRGPRRQAAASAAWSGALRPASATNQMVRWLGLQPWRATRLQMSPTVSLG